MVEFFSIAFKKMCHFLSALYLSLGKPPHNYAKQLLYASISLSPRQFSLLGASLLGQSFID